MHKKILITMIKEHLIVKSNRKEVDHIIFQL